MVCVGPLQSQYLGVCASANTQRSTARSSFSKAKLAGSAMRRQAARSSAAACCSGVIDMDHRSGIPSVSRESKGGKESLAESG